MGVLVAAGVLSVVGALFFYLSIRALEGGDGGLNNCGEVLGLDESEGVRLQLTPAVVRRGETKPEYMIINGGSEIVYFGEPYDIQRLEGGKWVSVEWMKGRAWIMVMHMLQPGKTFKREVELPNEVEPGCYRLVKRVTIEAPVPKTLNLTANFTVIK